MITVYFDLETGGVEDCRPDMQIAAVAVDDNWNELGAFEAKIQFECDQADPEALRINHYDAAIWRRDAIPLPTMIERFSNFIDPYRVLSRKSKRPPYRTYRVAQLAGHNAATFDGPRLKAMYIRAGLFLGADPRVLDTMQLAMWWFHQRRTEPENYKLGPLCQYFGISVGEDAHDALADVRLTVQLAKVLVAEGAAIPAA
jgi:DNA polymerase III epsilon subunit-like protein